jgi:hypothetical protein
METTAQHHATITRFLDRLKRRERRLLVVQSVSGGVAGVAVVGLAAALALSAGVGAHAVGAVGLTLGLLLIGAAVGWPLRGRWGNSGLVEHQARRVEARLPGLRGRLLTALDRSLDEHPGSPALLNRAASHASRAVALVVPSQVHSSRQTQTRFGLMVAVLMAVMGIGSGLPVGPLDALSVLFGASTASIRLADATVDEAADSALVGDIALRYVYPEYTGLEPKSVPNSDGTIIAPPGTEVRIQARTARPFQAAALDVEGLEPVDVSLAMGRDISGQVAVAETSRWRFLLFEGERVSVSPWYEVRAEADSAPVVVLSKSGELTVPLDAPLGIGWQVTDDYGIVRVALSVEAEGDIRETVLREPIDYPLEIDGAVGETPRALGLQAGDSVALRVVAVDNDRVEGGNLGESEPLMVKVLGPRGYGKNLTKHYERLLNALLDALADFLEEPVPPATTRPALVRWAYSSAERFDPIRELMERQWGDSPSSGVDGMLITDVLETSASLFRFTLTTFDKDVGAGGQQPVSRDIETFVNLHSETIETLETASFVMDTMLREVGVMELTRMAQKVAESAREAADQAHSTNEVSELTAQLDRLERQLNQLRKAAQELSDEALRDFTNSTLDQAGGLMEEIRKAIAEDRLDEARSMMDSLAEQMAQFAESLDERQQRGAAEDDEMGERFEALMEDLAAMAEKQDELADALAAAQDKFGTSFGERMSVWEQLDTLSDTLSTGASVALRQTEDGRSWRPFTLLRLQELAALGAGIRDSIRGRDAQGAQIRVAELLRDVGITQGFVERDMGRSPRPRNGASVQLQVADCASVGAQMAELLDRLMESPEQSSPELELAAQAMSDRQGELQDWQRELADEVKTVENAIPTASGDATKSMGGAGVAMERARDYLDQGVAIAGEGHQRQASDRVRETQEHLQQSMDDQQQMQQAMRQMQGEKGDESGDKKSNEAPQNQPDIPSPELFKTPEEYREALLEGMAGEVPEEFKALKARFYEDLVRQ